MQTSRFVGRVKYWRTSTKSKEMAAKQMENLGRLQDSIAATVGQLQATSEKLLDSAFPECAVPVFMLPIGSNPEDYALVFRFEEVLASLKSGVFVRPRIEVWAGRNSGYDMEHFADQLKQEFLRQFSEAKENLRKAGDIDLEELESGKKVAFDKMKGPLGHATGALIVLALTGGPIIDLLLLIFALYRGRKALPHLSEYLNLWGKKDEAQRDLKREFKRLDAEFNSKNKSFQRAVKNIDVRVHPDIQTLTRLIYEVEGGIFLPDKPETTSGDLPDVKPYLHSSLYVGQLPEHYWKLLDLI